ncbi:MAG TPA: hypothetical protein VFZ77_20835, partial [Acidimicrobiales bacterium]
MAEHVDADVEPTTRVADHRDPQAADLDDGAGRRADRAGRGVPAPGPRHLPAGGQRGQHRPDRPRPAEGRRDRRRGPGVGTEHHDVDPHRPGTPQAAEHGHVARPAVQHHHGCATALPQRRAGPQCRLAGAGGRAVGHSRRGEHRDEEPEPGDPGRDAASSGAGREPPTERDEGGPDRTGHEVPGPQLAEGPARSRRGHAVEPRGQHARRQVQRMGDRAAGEARGQAAGEAPDHDRPGGGRTQQVGR